METYDYQTPLGYGDTFYIYVYDGIQTLTPGLVGTLLVPGSNYLNKRVNILDGDFVLRYWRGTDLYANISQSIQIRDRLQNQFFSDTLSPFQQTTMSLMGQYMSTGWGVLPEKWYPDQGYIGFDLIGALPNVAPNVSGVGQLAFYGVRRRKGFKSDPQIYTNPSYSKEYQVQTTFSLPTGWSSASGGFLVSIPIQDFDFEVRRVDGFGGGVGIKATLLYQGHESVGPFLTAVAPGPAGNLISLVMIQSGINTPASISVTGNAITINVATDGGGAITSTNAQMVTLINTFPAAAALVTASTAFPAAGTAANGVEFLSGGSGSSGGAYAGLDLGNYKILLLDQNQVQVSNAPVLFTNFFHVPNNAVALTAQSSAMSVPKNFWPTPPMTYRVDSSIRFYVYMTSATPLGGPVSFDITFSGIRRYPCR